MIGQPMPTIVDELFKGAPPTEREQELLDRITELSRDLAYFFDFRNEILALTLTGERFINRYQLVRELQTLAERRAERVERFVATDSAEDILRADLRVARAEVERLRAALERYGEHETACLMGDLCNCGLRAALSA